MPSVPRSDRLGGGGRSSGGGLSTGGAVPRASRNVGLPPKTDDGSFWGNVIGDPIHAAVGLIEFPVRTAIANVQDVGQIIHGRTPTHTAGIVKEAAVGIAHDSLVTDIVNSVRDPFHRESLFSMVTGKTIFGTKPKESATTAQIRQGHIFVPILDIAGIATFGGARLAAVAAIPERASTVSAGQAIRRALVSGKTSRGKLETITVRDTETGAPIVVRTLPENVWQAGRMKAVDSAVKAVTHKLETVAGKPWGSFPVLGESARAGRAIERAETKVVATWKQDPRLRNYQRAFARLGKNARVALNTLARVPLPDDLEGWKAILSDQTGEAAQQLLNRLNKPEFRELYDDPAANKKLTAALDAARELVNAREEILAKTEALDPEAAAQGTYGATRVARGAEFEHRTVEEALAEHGPDPLLGRTVTHEGRDGTVIRFGDELPRSHTDPLAQAYREYVRDDPVAPDRMTLEEYADAHPELKAASEAAQAAPARTDTATVRFHGKGGGTYLRIIPTSELTVGKGRLVGGGAPEDIAAEIAAHGRPQPFYTPDVMAGGPGIRQRLSKSSGRTPPTSDVRASQRILMRMGLVALHPDLLTPSFLRAVAYDAKLAKHEEVKKIATPVAEGDHLPAGMEWVREVRGQKIPHTLTGAGEHIAEVGEAFPEDIPMTIKHEGEGEIAVDAQGRRLAVSRALAKRLEADVAKQGNAVKWIFQKPLDVWRALVLNLRVPWLINNIVGNNLLYALRFAGTDGLKAYIGLLSEPAKRQLYKFARRDYETKKHLTSADIDELFAEQARGTFIGTQTPYDAGGKFRRYLGYAGAGLAPLDRRSEAALRRAAVETVLRGSTEVRALYRAMPREERSLREAMRRAAAGNDDLKRLANQEANRALGDYLSLGPAERGAIRRVIPFYGWYREILRIATHAVVDTPARVALLSNLAIAEEERQQDLRGPFPSYLEGSLVLGKGPQDTTRILNLRSANPASTVADEIRIANLLVDYNNRAGASAALGALNPYGTALGGLLFRASQGDPTDPAYLGATAAALAHGGLPGYLASQVVGGLPYTQAITPPPPSKLFPTRSAWDMRLRLLFPYLRDISPEQAHFYASQNR